MEKIRRIIPKILVLFVIVNLISSSFYPVLVYAQDEDDPLLSQTPGLGEENDINRDFEAVVPVVVDEETQDRTLETYDELAQKMAEYTSQATNVSTRASFEEEFLQDPVYIPSRAVETLVEAPLQATNTGGDLLAGAFQAAGNFVGGVLGAVGQVFGPQTEEQLKEALQRAEGARAEPSVLPGEIPDYCNAEDFNGTPETNPECYPQERFERAKEKAEQAGIKVEGDPTNFGISLTGAPDLNTYTALNQASFSEEERGVAQKSAETLAKFVISLLPGGAFPELVEKSEQLLPETFIAEAACKQAGFVDTSYVRSLLAQTPKSGQKQRQEVLELGQQVNPQFRQQIEETRTLTYEELLARAKAHDPSLESRLVEIADLSQEDAKAKCGQETASLETKIGDLNAEVAANTALELAGALPLEQGVEIGVKAAKPVVRKITDPIGEAVGKVWSATAGRLLKGTGEELASPTVVSTTPPAPEKTFIKYAAGSSRPERFGITYRSGGEEEFNRLKQLYEVAPDNVPRPIRVMWDSEAVVPESIEMEFISGITAERYIKMNGSLPEGIKRQIKDAVEKFHKNGLAHGDLNPTNIIITPDGKVKFIDPVPYKDFTPEMVDYDLQTLDGWIDTGGSVPTNPLVVGAGSVELVVAKSREEIAQQAAGFAREVFPEGNDALESLVEAWLIEGMAEKEVRQAIDKAKALASYLDSNKGVVYPDPGRTDLEPREFIRPPSPDAPRQVREAWYALTYTGGGPEGGSRKILLDSLDAILAQQNDISLIGYTLREAKDILNELKRFCIEHRPASSLCKEINPGEALDPGSIHVVFGDTMVKRFKQSETAGGFYEPNSQQIVLRRDVAYEAILCAHEGVHKSCYRTNPQAATELTQSLLRGNTSQISQEGIARRNTINLVEGVTDFVAEFGSKLAGVRGEAGYVEQVNAIKEGVIPAIMQNSGLSQEEATAVIIEAALKGDFGGLFKAVGGGDLDKGVDLVNEIFLNVSLPSTYLRREGGQAAFSSRSIVKTSDINLAVSTVMAVIEVDEGGTRLLPRRLMTEVFAQEPRGSSVNKVNLQEFEFLVKKQIVKNALIEHGDIDSEFMDQVMRLDIFPAKTEATEDGYLVTTGRTGFLKVSVEQNKYVVNVNGISGIDIKVPGVIEVGAGQEAVLPVAVKEGTGKVEKIGFIREDDGAGKVYAQETDQGMGKVTVVVFADKNKNGKLDKNEDILPWAGLTVELKRVSKESVISLHQGDNQLSLPVLPDKLLTASILLREIALQGGEAISVSALENGAWKSYVAEGAKSYSFEDFPILPGKTYSIKANKDFTFILKGQEFAVPLTPEELPLGK